MYMCISEMQITRVSAVLFILVGVVYLPSSSDCIDLDVQYVELIQSTLVIHSKRTGLGWFGLGQFYVKDGWLGMLLNKCITCTFEGIWRGGGGGDAVNSCKDAMSQHYVSYNVQVEATNLVHRCTERLTMYMKKYEVIHFNNH